MAERFSSTSVDSKLSALEQAVRMLQPIAGIEAPIARSLSDIAAARFHLRRPHRHPKDTATLVAVLGGTGTGKSTLVNRLLGAEQHPLTAASFRRTHTAGPVAIAHDQNTLPDGWLGVDRISHDVKLSPARGEADRLTVIRSSHDLLRPITLIDTPDLDGDNLAHHAQADRVFRWADAAVFLVTPEKYQMTELLPYYRLAMRYGVPALFVMNKTEEQAVVDDYAQQLTSRDAMQSPRVFAIARDDATYTAPTESNLEALKQSLTSLAVSQSETGLPLRVADLLDRTQDQILNPLRRKRKQINDAIAALRAMESPTSDVDVSPLMTQLRRRLQQRSVLYLMGPGRMLDRVRQVPGLLARLPRTAWDLVRQGPRDGAKAEDLPPDLRNGKAGELDFNALLADQMRIVQARIEDVLASASIDASQLKNAMIDTKQAGAIADEELAKLRDWLNNKWNATPRDTALLARLIKHMPGGAKLARWSEAAPYLLAAVVATHHAFFGPVDLMVIGGWSLATWLTEKLSNEVASRARATNMAINRRFELVAHQQINRVCAWLDTQAPAAKALDDLQRLAERISEEL